MTAPRPRITYHLVPEPAWTALGAADDYRPDSLATEGFVHCTDGVAELCATGDRYYAADPRPYLVLAIDLERVGEWRFDDPERRFPHVYGPIPRPAIVRVSPAPRSPDGRFLPFAG